MAWSLTEIWKRDFFLHLYFLHFKNNAKQNKTNNNKNCVEYTADWLETPSDIFRFVANWIHTGKIFRKDFIKGLYGTLILIYI